jgi:hypothetical protein
MEHILWSILLYILFLLLPIIPAAIMFRMFPESQAGTTGSWGKMKFKASGAFAAYVITVFLGHQQVARIDARIDAMGEPTWKLWAKVSLQNNTKTPLADPHAVMKDLKVIIEPPLDGGAYPDISVRLPLLKPDEWPIVRLRLPGFQEQPINIKTALESETATRDSGKRSIKLKETIVLQQLPQAILNQPYPNDDPPLVPLLKDGPAIATNEIAAAVCASLPRTPRGPGAPAPYAGDPCIKPQP